MNRYWQWGHLLQIAIWHWWVGSDGGEDAKARRGLHQEEWTSVLLASTRYVADVKQQSGQLWDCLHNDGVVVPRAWCRRGHPWYLSACSGDTGLSAHFVLV